MTSRQRFRETMAFGTPDRVPYFEEGIRKDVLKSWYRQGLERGTDLSDLFPADRFDEIAPELNPIPDFDVWPSSNQQLDLLKKRLTPDHRARLPRKWSKMVRKWRQNDQLLFLRVHRGFFLSMGVHKWQRFTEVISLLLDDPDFVHKTMRIQGEFAAKIFENILKEIEIDAVVFTEPIGGNEGPLISPKMYEEFVLKNYDQVFEAIKSHGIETIILRTYANCRVLIPSMLKYGFNCLWACETNIEAMDYRDIRKEFGRDLRLIGGIDLDVLRQDKENIRREIEEKVPELIADGGYVPLADGRVRKDISFENYRYYRQLLEQVTKIQ